MKLAFFNIQNIFCRHLHLVKQYKSENQARWTAEFETLLVQPERSQKDYDRMCLLSHFLGFDENRQTPYFTIKNTMGQLRLRKGWGREMPKASHLTHWEGWAKVDSLPIDEVAIGNKAKVITEVDPDILVLLEVEDRASMVEFNRHFLSPKEGSPYKEIVFLETNDPYGRGMGILAKKGFHLESIRTHANKLDGMGNPIFDVDLQEYRFKTKSGLDVDILCTHFTNTNDNLEMCKERQKRQSEYISHLLVKKRTEAYTHSILLGTLNAPSYTSSIAPLIKDTNLRDITKHPHFMCDRDKGKDADYFRLGAYKMGVNIRQRDYLMLSKNLFEAVEGCGLVRKGMWYKKQPQWNTLGSIKNESQAASDHPLLWCYLKI